MLYIEHDVKMLIPPSKNIKEQGSWIITMLFKFFKFNLKFDSE